VPLRLAAACAIVVAVLLLGLAWSLSDETYSTRIGEQRIVSLEDGSRVHLNSGTRMDVELGDAMRRVRLERGEAFFEVARDPRKPFVVVAGDRSVTALGTSFVVRFEPQQTAVTLLEGKVAISARVDAPVDSGGASLSYEADALVLKPGERATFASSGATTVDVPPVDAMAAWRRGEVVLDETPLSLAVAEMNRYQRKRLVLDDPSIGELPVSGIYRTGSNEDFARAIATVYSLEVVENGGEIHLRRQN
jgi:transmembrane sensor